MNDLQKNILEQDISELFGFEEMSEEEKATLLDDIGSTILESATLRFMVESEDTAVEKFETVVEEYADKDEMLQKLLESFPRLGEILEEEIAAFKKEAVAVLAE